LEAIRWQSKQHFAAGVRALGDPLTDDDDPLTRPLTGELLHLHARDLRVTPGRVVVPAKPLHGRLERLRPDVTLAQLSQRIQELATAKAVVGSHQCNPDVGRQSSEGAAHKPGSVIHTGRVAPPQPKVGDERALGQRGDQLPMAGL
jgi:hypothetical protein